MHPRWYQVHHSEVCKVVYVHIFKTTRARGQLGDGPVVPCNGRKPNFTTALFSQFIFQVFSSCALFQGELAVS